MRAAVVVAVVTGVLFIGPASSAGVFPDLPGSDMLEETTGAEAPESASTSSNAPAAEDRVPAPEPSVVTREAVEEEQVKLVTSLPGAGNLPILKDVAESSHRRSSDAPLFLLAALFVVAYTRFLVRLNELGRRTV